jgi:hypothetical protein
MATSTAASITKDGGTWRMAGKQGCVYLWRGAQGKLRCSCATFRTTQRPCRHVRRLIQHLTACLQEMASEG